MFETSILLCGEGSHETARGGRPSHESVASLLEASLSRSACLHPTNTDLREKRGKSSELEGFLLLGASTEPDPERGVQILTEKHPENRWYRMELTHWLTCAPVQRCLTPLAGLQKERGIVAQVSRLSIHVVEVTFSTQLQKD